MILNLLEQLLTRKEQTLRLHGEIVDALRISGFLEWLRAKGNVLLFDPKDDANTQANKASFSAGYHACLDDILEFRNIISDYEKVKKLPQGDFGARSALVASGKFTQEEADKVGKTPIGY